MMTPGGPAERERVQPPSMTGASAALQNRGPAPRALHLTGRRRVVLAITCQGRKLLDQSRRLREARLASRLGEPSPQERAAPRPAVPILGTLGQS
jgi:DNA-binding MarR family transcriptional regulator